MTATVLAEHKRVWDAKPALRTIYADYYRRIVAACEPGTTLEIGGGTGNLKSYRDEVVATDLVLSRWVDAAADAQQLPFADAAFTNIVGVDVLHHIENVPSFLAEAVRVLRPGGRLVLLEPAITPLSWIFFKLFHPEPVVMSQDPLAEPTADPNRQPFDANQAIPTLLAGRDRKRLQSRLPELELTTVQRFSFLTYPLSGGFRPWCLVPARFAPRAIALEERLVPLFGRLAAFRLFLVFTKR